MREVKKFMISISIGLAVFAQIYSAPTNTTPLVQIDSKDFGETNFVMKVIELERKPKTSLIKMIYDRRSPSVGSSMYVMFAFYEIAKARNTEYFINLKEWDDEQGNHIYIGGFTNTKEADIKKEFGQSFSNTDRDGESRDFMSVSKVKKFFEKKAVQPSNPSNGVPGDSVMEKPIHPPNPSTK